MIRKKSTCGLCKPDKKWKKNDTKAKSLLNKEIGGDILGALRGTLLKYERPFDPVGLEDWEVLKD